MIYINYMTYEALAVLKSDIKKNDAQKINNLILENQNDSKWLDDFTNVNNFEEIKCYIEEFNLKYTDGTDNKENDYQNAITLYEHLNKVPRYILTEERFWAWLNFTLGYKYAVRRVPIKSKSTIGDHYLFNKGNRRGIFFGVLSRLYFYVELSVDNSLTDKYELTKFALENFERIRNLTWRANSSEKQIVLSALKAEKYVYEKYMLSEELKQQYLKGESNNLYSEIAKHISLYGSVRLIDAVNDNDLQNEIIKFMENFITKVNK